MLITVLNLALNNVQMELFHMILPISVLVFVLAILMLIIRQILVFKFVQNTHHIMLIILLKLVLQFALRAIILMSKLVNVCCNALEMICTGKIQPPAVLVHVIISKTHMQTISLVIVLLIV